MVIFWIKDIAVTLAPDATIAQLEQPRSSAVSEMLQFPWEEIIANEFLKF